MPGLGDGIFGAVYQVSVNEGATHHIALGDLNGDQLPDIVALRAIGDFGEMTFSLDLLLNEGNGLFAAPVPYALPGVAFLGSAVFAIGDVDSDGNIDVVCLNSGDFSVDLLIYRGDGAGGLTQSWSEESDMWAQSIRLDDWNQDGALDLIADGRVQWATATVHSSRQSSCLRPSKAPAWLSAI